MRNMTERAMGAWLMVASCLWAGPANAQYLGGGTKTGAQAQVADLEDMRMKFVALADAIPDDRFAWKPMEGVRSVHDVFALVVTEAELFPTMWSFERPAWAKMQFNEELSRLALLSRADVAKELERSFDHVIGLVRGLSAADRAKQVSFFGLNVDLATAITLMTNDMHEHLGQLIAYARMNGVVPPWSRPGGN
jgi:uncharacterized damage-inducible protein DinB